MKNSCALKKGGGAETMKNIGVVSMFPEQTEDIELGAQVRAITR